MTSLPISIAWYRDVLGFTVARTYDRAGTPFAASFKAGTVTILLTQADGARGADRVRDEGFSLQLTTPQNIDELAGEVLARGGTIDAGPLDVMGARVFRLCDPDGFRFAVSAER